MIRMNPEGRTLLNGMNADLSNVLYVLSFQTMLCILKTTFRSVKYQATKSPASDSRQKVNKHAKQFHSRQAHNYVYMVYACHFRHAIRQA